MEIPRVVVGMAGPQPAAGVAGLRVFDLDHLGAEPGQRLGAGRPRLELGEVDNPHAFEAVQRNAFDRSHSPALLPKKSRDYYSASDRAAETGFGAARQIAGKRRWSESAAGSACRPARLSHGQLNSAGQMS